MIRRQIIIKARKDFLRNGEGSAVIGPDGEILLVFTRFYGGTHDESPSDIWAIRSIDGCDTWSRPWPVIDNAGSINTMSASLALCDDGGILCGVIVKESLRKSSLRFYRSDDGGKTFSGPYFNLETRGVIGMCNDKIIRTRDRVLVGAVSLTQGIERPGSESRMDSTQYTYSAQAAVILSRDDGQTWNLADGRVALDGRGAMEPTVAEIGSRRLMMTMRTQAGWIYSSYSDDDGRTWFGTGPMGVPSPEASHALKRCPRDNRLYLAYNPAYIPNTHHFGPRYPLLLAVSGDEGAHWSDIAEIEPEGARAFEFSNQWIFFRGDEIFIAYYNRHLDRDRPDFNRKDLKLARISLGN